MLFVNVENIWEKNMKTYCSFISYSVGTFYFWAFKKKKKKKKKLFFGR